MTGVDGTKNEKINIYIPSNKTQTEINQQKTNKNVFAQAKEIDERLKNEAQNEKAGIGSLSRDDIRTLKQSFLQDCNNSKTRKDTYGEKVTECSDGSIMKTVDLRGNIHNVDIMKNDGKIYASTGNGTEYLHYEKGNENTDDYFSNESKDNVNNTSYKSVSSDNNTLIDIKYSKQKD